MNHDLLKQAYEACEDMPGIQQDRCPLCERAGLPILPVRYAVCEKILRTAEIPELSPDRVAEFTEITLDKTIANGTPEARTLDAVVQEHQGNTSTSQVNKYILRQLRPGYFYILDDENERNVGKGEREGRNWYAYVVTTDGMFYQFAVSATPPPTEQSRFSCGETPDIVRHKAMNASLIALDSVDTATNIYYAFSEFALPIEFLNHLRTGQTESGQRVRDVAMQKINIAQWRNGTPQPYAFPAEQLDDVAEYSDGAWGMEEFFWPDQPHRRLFDREEFKEVMKGRLHAASDQLQDKGLILGVMDEVGIITELNAYRTRQLDLFEEFLQQTDSEGQLNRRNLLCMKAIDAFEVNYRMARLKEVQASAEQQDAEHMAAYGEAEKARREDLRGIKQRMAELEALEDRSLSQQLALDGLRIDRDFILQQRAQDDRYLDAYQTRRRETPLEVPDSLMEDYHTELAECYASGSGTPLDTFRQAYDTEANKIRLLVAAYDDDYSQWVQDHLAQLVLRYDSPAFGLGLGVSGLLSNCLRNGIMSDASRILWKTLSESLEQPDSLLLKTMFASQTSLMQDAMAVCQSLSDGRFVDADTLLSWKSKYRDLLASEPEFRYDTIMANVATVLGDALYALTVQNHQNDTSEAPSPEQQALLTYNRYLQLILTGSHHVQRVEHASASDGADRYLNLPLLARVRVKRSDYFSWVKEITQQIYPRGPLPKNPNDPPFRAFEFREDQGVGGNFAVEHIEQDATILVTIPVDSTDADVLAHYMARVDDYSLADAEDSAWSWRQDARSLGGTISQGIGNANGHAGMKAMSGAFARGLVVYNNVGVLIKEATSEDADGRKVASAMIKLSLVTADGVEFAATHWATTNQTLTSMDGALKFSRGPLEGIGGVLSIMDGLDKFDLAERADMLGLPDSTSRERRIMGSIDVIEGGLAILAVGLAFVAGSLATPAGGVAAATTVAGYYVTSGSYVSSILKLLFGARFAELVAPAVVMWVRRCRFGIPKGLLEPYDSLEAEKSGLGLIFKGVTVEMVYEDAEVHYSDSGVPVRVDGIEDRTRMQGEPSKIFEILVTVPDLDAMELTLELEAFKGAFKRTLFDLSYKKLLGGDLGAVKRYSGKFSDGGRVRKNDGCYKVSVMRFYKNEDLGDAAELRVEFIDKNNTAHHGAQGERDKGTGSFIKICSDVFYMRF